MGRYSLLHECWLFMRERKKYWLLPIILLLLAFGALILFTESTALSPFFYIFF